MSGDPRDSVAPGDPDVTRASAHPAGTSEQIGPYRILELIGEGGMGKVYLAEQRTGAASVALKVIKAGMDTQAGHRPVRSRAAGAGADGSSQHRDSLRRRRDRQGPTVFRRWSMCGACRSPSIAISTG